MVVVAKTLQLMPYWNFYFWTTLVITFIVTAIVVRLYTTAHVTEAYTDGVTPQPEEVITGNRLSRAWQEALLASSASGNIAANVWRSTREGLHMVCNILPTIMSIGLFGMLMALYTPLFNWLGYIFYPFTAMMQVPDALVVAQALATSIAEMFLPAAFVVKAAIAARYVVAVVCISELLFFSALIPCILSTTIPVSIPKLLVLWVERTILSIILAGAVALFSF